MSNWLLRPIGDIISAYPNLQTDGIDHEFCGKFSILVPGPFPSTKRER